MGVGAAALPLLLPAPVQRNPHTAASARCKAPAVSLRLAAFHRALAQRHGGGPRNRRGWERKTRETHENTKHSVASLSQLGNWEVSPRYSPRQQLEHHSVPSSEGAARGNDVAVRPGMPHATAQRDSPPRGLFPPVKSSNRTSLPRAHQGFSSSVDNERSTRKQERPHVAAPVKKIDPQSKTQHSGGVKSLYPTPLTQQEEEQGFAPKRPRFGCRGSAGLRARSEKVAGVATAPPEKTTILGGSELGA